MPISRIKMGRRGHKRFEYRPRHYDERKEDLENRVERITSEVTGNYSQEGSRRRLETAFKNRGRQPLDAAGQQQRLASRVRFLLIAGILGSLAYLVFYTNTLDVIFEGFK
jgi:hypothetical protein